MTLYTSVESPMKARLSKMLCYIYLLNVRMCELAAATKIRARRGPREALHGDILQQR